MWDTPRGQIYGFVMLCPSKWIETCFFAKQFATGMGCIKWNLGPWLPSSRLVIQIRQWRCRGITTLLRWGWIHCHQFQWKTMAILWPIDDQVLIMGQDVRWISGTDRSFHAAFVDFPKMLPGFSPCFPHVSMGFSMLPCSPCFCRDFHPQISMDLLHLVLRQLAERQQLATGDHEAGQDDQHDTWKVGPRATLWWFIAMEKMIIMIINWNLQANLSIDVGWPRQLYVVVSIAGMPQNGKFIIEKHTKKTEWFRGTPYFRKPPCVLLEENKRWRFPMWGTPSFHSSLEFSMNLGDPPWLWKNPFIKSKTKGKNT